MNTDALVVEHIIKGDALFSQAFTIIKYCLAIVDLMLFSVIIRDATNIFVRQIVSQYSPIFFAIK